MQENDKKVSEPGSADAPLQHTRVRHVEVTTNELNQRIDNFLLRRCPGVPRTHIYRIIRKGEVRVDGKRVKPTRKLAVGCLLYTSPSPRDGLLSRMPSSA